MTASAQRWSRGHVRQWLIQFDPAAAMSFRLHYRGKLPSNGNREDKHRIREAIHLQLLELWARPPLADHVEYLKPRTKPGDISLVFPAAGYNFSCLVSQSWGYLAHLDITLLRPEPAGLIITKGGDIDNRLKTLFDALRPPQQLNELPSNYCPPANGILHCLLEDDSLITKVSVETDYLLDARVPDEVLLLIQVHMIKTRNIIGNWNITL
jgi:hypothetical protein